jgi:hypothetical protein
MKMSTHMSDSKIAKYYHDVGRWRINKIPNVYGYVKYYFINYMFAS